MAITKVFIIAVIGWACHLVAAQEKVCSNFCSSLGMLQSSPGKSCNDIYQINKASRGASGNYWINTTTGVHQVYCDMELECGGHKGGWMRIADLDTSRGDDCPSGWTKITTNDGGQPFIDVCRSPIDSTGGCHSTAFTVNRARYHKICGKARGYQKFSTDAFSSPSKSINEAYVDGVSITLGNPRKHVWTYAVGFSEEGPLHTKLSNCPCAATSGKSAHPFIYGNYYCESGSASVQFTQDIIHTSDPLWDGNGCVFSNNNCCSDANMPWFYRQFPMPQNDDIEVRLCTDNVFANEAVVVDQLQLYVQ